MQGALANLGHTVSASTVANILKRHGVEPARWVRLYYLWRPILPDEADNHLVELAVAGSAEAIVTHNTRDFERAELHFPKLCVMTPAELITEE